MISHGDDIFRYDDIRLNFSSNVYGHFDHSALYAHLSGRMACITSYPEPTPSHLESVLASHLHVSPDNIMVTNGATEAIYLIAQAFAGTSSAIVQPTFSEYEQACTLHGHSIMHTDASSPLPTALVWLCNPNNPTGTVMPKDTLVALIASHPHCTFIIDQSYAPYYHGTLLSATDVTALGNVILLHSMTKEYGIPGLRLGYVVGSRDAIRRLSLLRMPWSVNALAIEAGLFLTTHPAPYIIPVRMLNDERQRLSSALSATGIIDVHPSDTHILLCRLHSGTAAWLKEHLATRHGILIRDASNFRGLTPQHFRIAVQRPEDNNALLEAVIYGITEFWNYGTP